MVTSLPQKASCEYTIYYLAKGNTHLAHAWCEWILTTLSYYHVNSRLRNQMFWECNFEAKDVGLVCQAKGFRYSVVKARAEYHFHFRSNYQSVLEQIIWFNSHLRTEGKPFFNETLYVGIITIQDMWDGNGFIPHEELIDTYYNENSRLRFYAILNCINRKWHALLHNCRDEIVLDSESKYDQLLSSESAKNCIYCCV